MKKIISRMSLLVLFLLTSNVHGGDLLKQAQEKLRGPGEKIFLDVKGEKKKKLSELEKEKAQQEKETASFQENTEAQLKEINENTTTVKRALEEDKTNDFLNKKISILNRQYQALKDAQKSRAQILELINEHIKLLKTYLDDPNFNQFKKQHKFKNTLYYSFNDLQYLTHAILEQEKRFDQLKEQEKNANTELEHRKQAAAASEEAYKKRKEEIEKAGKAKENDEKRLSEQQVIELLNLEEQLYNDTKLLNDLRQNEIRHKVELIQTKRFINETELNILKDELKRIKPSIRITEAQIEQARDELAKKRQESITKRENYRQKIDLLLAQQQEISKQLATLSKQFNIPLGPLVNDWTLKPEETINSYIGLCRVGTINAQILLLESKRMLWDVHRSLEEEKLDYEAIQVKAKESFQKITSRKFVTEDAIAKEIKEYSAPKADAQADLALYKARIAEVEETLNEQNQILERISQLRKDIDLKRNTLFRKSMQGWMICLESLARAEKLVKERIDILKKLNAAYASITTTITNTIRHIDFIISELQTITIWYRPEYAVSWEGVKNILSDLEKFLADISAYIASFDIATFITSVQDILLHPMNVFFILFKLFILIILLFIFRYFIPRITDIFLRITRDHTGLLRFFAACGALLFSFINTYFGTLLLWVIPFAFMMMQATIDPYLFIFFYLGSIPYLVYVCNRFIAYIVSFNERNQYILLSEEFQRRFILVVGTLLYATLVIVFFRKAFILSDPYGRSELPDILLAVNFIIFQLSLIFLISKEQILSLIPSRTDFWKWIRGQIDRYYILILMIVVAIIIMSNPYVGFGRLVLFILRNVVFTSALILGMFWLYGLFKRVASTLFFAREEEVVRERFANAKTWFGLLIIAIFLLTAFFGVIIGARIWGWPMNFKDALGWLTQPIVPGLTPPITVQSLLHLIMFVLAGFMASYALRRFVLDKIFDLLLIDTGVQHTVTSIMRYIILTAALFLGFQQVGLGNLVVYFVGALALGIGWILKEPIGDFVGYFIILVQRPIKIGDFIKIDEDTVGVVRRITPRAVVLRRKNSTTIVVPNSYVINRSVINWNYVRKFIAFNDIMITITYDADPVKVKQLLYQVVESHPNVLKNPKPIIRLEEFGEYGFKFLMRGFLSDIYTLDQWDIASDIRLATVRILREHGIKIAVPVRIMMKGAKDTTIVMEGGRIPEGGGAEE